MLVTNYMYNRPITWSEEFLFRLRTNVWSLIKDYVFTIIPAGSSAKSVQFLIRNYQSICMDVLAEINANRLFNDVTDHSHNLNQDQSNSGIERITKNNNNLHYLIVLIWLDMTP